MRSREKQSPPSIPHPALPSGSLEGAILQVGGEREEGNCSGVGLEVEGKEGDHVGTES